MRVYKRRIGASLRTVVSSARAVQAAGCAVLLSALGFGCAPEIQAISPVVVACDQIVAVQGQHLDDKISLSVAGVEVPHSGLEITDKKVKVGFSAGADPV